MFVLLLLYNIQCDGVVESCGKCHALQTIHWLMKPVFFVCLTLQFPTKISLPDM